MRHSQGHTNGNVALYIMCMHICDHIYENQPVSEKINYRVCTEKSFVMEIKKKKRGILKDKALDWLQIWTAVSSLDENGNKANQKEF